MQPRRVSTLSLVVLINARAAGAYVAGQSAGDVIGRAFALFGIAADIRLVSPQDFSAALALVRRRDRPLIVAGGDGSVSAALQVFAHSEIPVGVLPLGTYNLLAQDLGTSGPIAEAVAHIAGGAISRIDLGRTGGQLFHTLAGIGFFARAARERASIRRRLPGSRVLGAMIAAVRSLRGQGNLHVEIDDGRERTLVRTPAILVTNNVLDAQTWRRPRLDGGVLELHIADGDTRFPLLQGGIAAIRGNWRDHPGVLTWIAPSFRIAFRRPKVFASLDGEISRRDTPLAFDLVPRALTCYVAADRRAPQKTA